MSKHHQSPGNPAGSTDHDHGGSPFAPHSERDVEFMLAAIGADSVEDLFDIPPDIRFDDEFDIEDHSEQGVMRQLRRTLANNEDRTEFLGGNHYSHYVPSIVDHLSLRSEFITSYTQYQPEMTQGFLQVLFEYQSLLVELTGLSVANCSMYDAATALGEAATLANRVRNVDGSRILIPEYLRSEQRAVLESYVSGTDLSVEEFPTPDGLVDPNQLDDAVDEDVVMVYAETPARYGVIEEHLNEIGSLSAECDALFCLGTDLVALALLQEPASVGADIVVGDASVLGLPTAYGMGLGIFACREEFLRQVPGRLVGASEDADGARSYTLTLQTREQHIRRERATSNICTNQAWVALRTAIHASALGASGLVSLAEQCHRLPERIATDLNEVNGVTAPVRDCYHFREFKARIDGDAGRLADELGSRGFAVHAHTEDEIGIAVTDVNEHRADDLVRAIDEVMN